MNFETADVKLDVRSQVSLFLDCKTITVQFCCFWVAKSPQITKFARFWDAKSLLQMFKYVDKQIHIFFRMRLKLAKLNFCPAKPLQTMQNLFVF